MAVSQSYREFILEQLSRVVPVTSRSMFGCIGVYSSELFFAIVADDTLYFKVDDSNRSDYQSSGMRPFRPYGNQSRIMPYYEVPGEVLEDPEKLRPWVEKALAVATKKQRR